MQKMFAFLLGLMMVSSFYVAADTSQINWLTSYEDALKQSKSTSKPIVLFFTGSDWCGWCHKLEDESLNTAEFARAAGDKYIFVKLDFPMNRTLPGNQSAQNKQLQKKYDVRGFPSIVIIDSNERQIGVTGYRPGGGKQYADHLGKIVSDYSGYQQKVQNVGNQPMSGLELKELYQKAREFGLDQDANAITKLGVNSDERSFFLLEKYRNLVYDGHGRTPEAVSLRDEILKGDPENKNLTHYQIAVIDFEACCEKNQSEKSADVLVAPLTGYIEKFGDKDKTNLWRLHMIVSQVYFDKNNLKEALKHAEYAHNNAPASVQPDIALVIQNIKSQK